MADHYDQNPLIQALDAKRKAAIAAQEAEEGKKVRVISIRTRKEWVAPEPKKPKRLRRPKIDKESIEMLEHLLDEMKEGRCEGLLFAVTNREDGSFTFGLSLPPGKQVQPEAARYIGGIELLKQDLLELAEYGEDAMMPDDVVLLDGPDDPELGA